MAQPLEIFCVLDLMINHFVSVLTRRNSLILSLSLFLQLSLQKLSIVICIDPTLLICMEIIFISSDYLENIFFMEAYLSYLISDYESLSSR